MLLVLIGLILLLITQRLIILFFSKLIHRLGGGQRAIIWTWSLIFLPGTLVHEISHFFMAGALGLRTGKIEIFPEYVEDALEKERGGRAVKLGSVQIARPNPLQGFFVGAAPFIVGLSLLVYLSSLLQSTLNTNAYLQLTILGYFFFTVANSFFPSWSDIKQTLPLVTIIVIVAVGIWLSGISFMVNPTSPILGIIATLGRALTISVIINLAIALLLFLTTQVFHNAHHR